jgi:glycerate dehydrogenase
MSTSIVVLDGYTLNPGDLSWKSFEQQGNLTVHERTPADQIIARAKDAPAVLTNKAPLSAATLRQLPELKYIGVLATGYNIVDIQAAAEQGVTVTNVPSYSSESVAQHAMALLLELARGIGLHSQAVRDGQWGASKDFCFSLSPIVELNGKTMGIIGLGRIGVALGKIAAAMGMNIIATSSSGRTAKHVDGLPVKWVQMDELFKQSDVISLHCPLTPQTEHLVNAPRLAMMKPTAFVLNTARGQLIDNQALADALKQGRLAGAGLDVLASEPPDPKDPKTNALIEAPNCVITPHLAWYARESRQRLMSIASDNLKAFLAGQPQNVIASR